MHAVATQLAPVPHPVVLTCESAGHVAHAPPHHIVPELQVSPQLVPSQLAEPLASPGHAEHIVPQLDVEVLDTQLPLQSCVPLVHSHAWVLVLHVSFAPVHCADESQPGVHCPVPVSQYVRPLQLMPLIRQSVTATQSPELQTSPRLQRVSQSPQYRGSA